jgi:hypothetical protein
VSHTVQTPYQHRGGYDDDDDEDEDEDEDEDDEDEDDDDDDDDNDSMTLYTQYLVMESPMRCTFLTPMALSSASAFSWLQ